MRTGDWLETFKGVRFYPFDPRPEDVLLEDIAHALSNQCRFGGHSRKFYSVAQHSVLVSDNCNIEKNRLAGLLHDAAEAYLIDLPRPIKHTPGMLLYRQIEERLMLVIFQRFGVPYPLSDDVHIADNRVLLAEKRDLMGNAPWSEKRLSAKPIDQKIVPLSAKAAKALFLDRARELNVA